MGAMSGLFGGQVLVLRLEDRTIVGPLLLVFSTSISRLCRFPDPSIPFKLQEQCSYMLRENVLVEESFDIPGWQARSGIFARPCL